MSDSISVEWSMAEKTEERNRESVEQEGMALKEMDYLAAMPSGHIFELI